MELKLIREYRKIPEFKSLKEMKKSYKNVKERIDELVVTGGIKGNNQTESYGVLYV